MFETDTLMKSLTRKQFVVFSAVKNFISRNGYAPSYTELAKWAGLRSVATVSKHVEALVQKGWLVKRFNEARSLEVVPDGARGWQSCDNNHQLIFFGTRPCPVCCEKEKSSDVVRSLEGGRL